MPLSTCCPPPPCIAVWYSRLSLCPVPTPHPQEWHDTPASSLGLLHRERKRDWETLVPRHPPLLWLSIFTAQEIWQSCGSGRGNLLFPQHGVGRRSLLSLCFSSGILQTPADKAQICSCPTCPASIFLPATKSHDHPVTLEVNAITVPFMITGKLRHSLTEQVKCTSIRDGHQSPQSPRVSRFSPSPSAPSFEDESRNGSFSLA